MHRSKIGPIITALAGLLLSSCGREAEVRYRVSVGLGTTPSSPRGAAVWSLALSEPLVSSDGGYGAVFRAQAIVIDLGGDRRFVALIRGADFDRGRMPMLPERLFGESVLIRGEVSHADRYDRVKVVKAIVARPGDTAKVDCVSSPDLCPMLVVFDDINDPTSIKHINSQTAESLIGVPLSSVGVTVTIVDDEVSTGIFSAIPWLSTHQGSLLPERSNRPQSQRPFATKITVHDFVHGLPAGGTAG